MLCVAPNCSAVVCYWCGICRFARKCFSTIFEVFSLYAKMCIISHAPTMKQQIRLRFTGHSRTVGHGVRSFCCHEYRSGPYILKNLRTLDIWYTYLLAYSMEQSSSREANRFSDSRDIPHILWSPRSSSPNSQMTANRPYPQTHRSNPCPHNPLPEDSS